MKRKKSPARPRVPVANRAGQVFRLKKGRGSYLRRVLKECLKKEGY